MASKVLCWLSIAQGVIGTDKCAKYTPEMKDVDISGELLGKIQSSDMTECCLMCDCWPGCEGYVFHLDQCYLKKDLGKPQFKQGALTRIKFSSLVEMPVSNAN